MAFDPRLQTGYYEGKTQEQHIYSTPETYLGNDEKEERIDYLLDYNTRKIHRTNIYLPEAVLRLFLEVLSNAGDNMLETRETIESHPETDFDRLGIKWAPIEVKMDKTGVTVRNYGNRMPVEVGEKTKGMYIPEYVFGEVLTSSNYRPDKPRFGAGKNGFGAKLPNIFSHAFRVVVVDSYTHKQFTQVWYKNKSIKTPYQIVDVSPDLPSMVEVWYSLDFARFGLTEYPDEAFYLFARQCLDMGYAYRVPISFNGVDLTVHNLTDYVAYFITDEKIKKITHFEYLDKDKKKGKSLPVLEMCMLDTPRVGRHISYFNGMPTPAGGVHVDACYKAVFQDMIDGLNKLVQTKDSSKTVVKLNMGDVKRNITLIVSCRLPNPKFDSQKKEKVKSPTPSLTLSSGLLKEVENWAVVGLLTQTLTGKITKKVSGRKKRFVDVPKCEEANWAGTAKSQQATLILVEGDSAKNFPMCYLDRFANGRDIFGVFPVKGKLLNVKNATEFAIIRDPILEKIQRILNLVDKMDYSLDENFNTLRYGRVLIMADADVDGKHITGLINLFFLHRFPSLYFRNFVCYMRTPIKEIEYQKTNYKFFTETAYQKFIATYPELRKVKPIYHKGLGGFKSDQIIKDSELCRNVLITVSQQCYDITMKAFDKARIKDRKDWILSGKAEQIDHLEVLPLGWFVEKEMIEYALDNLERAIPTAMDGLKNSQQKILWGVMKKWNIYSEGKKLPVKVSVLGSYISSKTNYAHGETSLNMAIINLTQNFAGSNNLPLFKPVGLFGSRNDMGKDASDPRYCSVSPAKWLPLMFRKEDEPLLKMKVEEDKQVEPIFFLPILPLQAINGAEGIATGWSTFIPSFHPVQICDWFLKRLLSPTKIPDMLQPYYQGFNGTISVINNRSLLKETEDESEEDRIEGDLAILEENTKTHYQAEGSGYIMVTTGKFRVLGKKIEITEIPLRVSTHKYDRWLLSLIKEKKIKDKTNHSRLNSVRFLISDMVEPPSVNSLHLRNSFSLNNMTLLDPNHKPIHFANINNMLEWFFQFRVQYYPLRKNLKLTELHQKVIQLSHKYMLVRLVVTNPLDFINRSIKDHIQPILTKHGIPIETLKAVKLTHLTSDDLPKIAEDIEKVKAEYDSYSKIDPRQLWYQEIIEFKKYCLTQFK